MSRGRRRSLDVGRADAGERSAAIRGVAAVDGIALNASATVVYSRVLGAPDTGVCDQALRALGRRVSRGDLSELEAILSAQAAALNAMFTQLALQAASSTVPEQVDRLTRLALKAQAQCRATVETLGLLKRPSAAVFAKQANIAAGPQQITNINTVGGDTLFPLPVENVQNEL